MEILNPIKNVKIVDRDILKANHYNPNIVSKRNLKLLIQSILTNGWTSPIVVTEDYTIIDGYHRWLVSGMDELKDKLHNKVPIVIVEHEDKADNVYGTITHNRARGTNLLGPMKSIIKGLLEQGKTIKELSIQLGMSPEEIFRLSDFSRESFLKKIIGGEKKYSKAKYIVKF